jgi:hypothetical protein
LKNWAAAWKKTDAFSIQINFRKAVDSGQVKLWCHGDIPSIELYSKVGDNWVKEGSVVLPANAEEVDVREITIPFKQKAKIFELRFGKRSKGEFFIGELEFWQLKK